MGNWIRVKHKHIWYNPNKKRTASWEKYKKTIKSYLKLLKRIKIEWETKWIKNEMAKIEAKFKKYWVTKEQIEAVK